MKFSRLALVAASIAFAAGQAPSGGAATAAAAATGQPGHVYVARDARGIARFAVDGKPFDPICMNELIEATVPYKTFDMFGTKRFELGPIDRTLGAIEGDGYTCVRLWLKGYDTDDGFAAQPGGAFDQRVWRHYVENVDAVLRSTRAHHLRVVLTGSFPGPNAGTMLFMPKNYVPPAASLPPVSAVNGINRLILIPVMPRALGRFYADLLTALVATDPKLDDGMLYFDLYNEMHFDLLAAPFGRTSGSFTYGGTSYDLGSAVRRQALMDRATKEFTATLARAVKGVVPDMLVTESSGFNSDFNRFRFDGGLPNGKDPDGEMLRPYFMLAGGGDVIDIHTYPGPAYPEYNLPPFNDRALAAFASDGVRRPQDPPAALSVSAHDAPLVAGEFGGSLPKFGVTLAPSSPLYAHQYASGLNEAIAEMHATEQDAFCPFGFAGFGIWAWGTPDGAADTFNVISRYDPNGLFMRAFSPKYRPRLCGDEIR